MWFDGAGEIVELFKTSFPLSILFFVPIFIIISPVSPVGAAHDFAVYRMQQYDLQGSAYGCRNTLVNVEGRSIDSNVYTRRCVVTRLQNLTLDKYQDVISQNGGGLLVLLPHDLSTLSKVDKEHLLELEQDLMQSDTQLPVYFTPETPELLEIYQDIQGSTNSDQAGSAAEALLSSASANGFQFVLGGAQSKAMNDFQVVNIQGKLAGYGIEEQLPTIAIIAHYDAFGIAPSLAKGTDSNASGVVTLLELARLFSKLYTSNRTHAKFNMMFLLSGAGKFNYQGTRRWIEDQLESTELSLLGDVSYVLCLDALGVDDSLNLHVSKPPKEGSAGDLLVKSLQDLVQELFPHVDFNVIHKKINLADDYLAWEHERFSIRRLPAFTLSHLPSHKSLMRNSILDTRQTVSPSVLTRNIKLLSEALARQIFNVTNSGSSEVFTDGLQVEQQLVVSWLDFLSSHSRAAQLLTKDSHIVQTLEQGLTRYLRDVKRHVFKADKRDPEFVFYTGAEFTMSAYNVKPAVFDLFLALAIAAYLAAIYLVVQHFDWVYILLRKMATPAKVKRQ